MFKKGSANPGEVAMKMLHMIAIENLFRMSLTYLKKNQKKLREGMKENRDQLDSKVVKRHESMMNKIVAGMYPKGKIALANFKQLEIWLGHDLLLNGLAELGKTGGKDKPRFQYFVKDVQKDPQWDTFVQEEIAAGRNKPDKDASYKDEPKATEEEDEEDEEEETTSMQVKSRSERHKIRGELYLGKSK